MPVYKYHCAKNDVVPYYKTLVLTIMILTILGAWTLGISFMIQPMSFGIGLTCVVECISIVILLWCNTYSVSKLQAVKAHVDDDIVKQAWLQTKTNMLQHLNIQTPSDYVSYEAVSYTHLTLPTILRV